MIVNKNIVLLLIVLTVTLISCGEKKEENIPDNLIEKPILTSLLIDFQLIEAHLNEVRVDQAYIRDSANHYYKEIYNKYDITHDDFSRSIEYYATKPGELQDMYDDVLDKLSEMEAELIDIKVDEVAFSPLGKHQVAEIIVKLPIAPIYLDSSLTAMQIQDSLFKYIVSNPGALDTLHTNIASFQKSYVGLTYKKVMYISLREEIKLKLDVLDKIEK